MTASKECVPASAAKQQSRVGLNRYCTESVPFYRHLSSRCVGPVRTFDCVVASNEPAGDLQAYLSSQQLSLRAVAGLRDSFVRFTPTLIIADPSGVVRRVWTGLLSPDARLEVEQALRQVENDRGSR